MSLENTYTDIFTEFDDAIFSDGSIDPVGIRMIWTSLGNSIFRSKLNTISTNIRYYTLNLFHHHIIQQCEARYEDKIINLTNRPPFNNRQDLYDGIIIFLESLLAHALIKSEYGDINDPIYSVPGVNKLIGIIQNTPSDKKAVYLLVDKKEGILVRHILLGIHGRHKGPFQQMGLFHKNHYYLNKAVWQEISELFAREPWYSLTQELIEIIETHILSIKSQSTSQVKIRVHSVLAEPLIKKYFQLMQPDNFRKQEFIDFWEKNLGLLDGTANLLYNQLKAEKEKGNYEDIIKKASVKGNPEQNKYIQAICAIEPFLTCVEKITSRLLKRGTSSVDDAIAGFINKWLNSSTIDLDKINEYLTETYLSQEALLRLKKLLSIYINGRKEKDSVLFVRQLVSFHHDIMKNRNNLPWISMGATNNINLHRSFQYSEQEINSFSTKNWVNNYYMSTVLSLYNGLYMQ